jgi:hypothetical protein
VGAARGTRTSAAILASVAAFVALYVPAMLLYPGGTWFDATTRGASFWQNFLCDLEARVALDGRPNPIGSRLAQAAMLVLTLGLAPFWVAIAQLVTESAETTTKPPQPEAWSAQDADHAAEAPRIATAIRWLGLVAVVGIVAVALLPSDRFGPVHGVAVLTAGGPGLTTAVLATVALLGASPTLRREGMLGVGTLVFAMSDFVLYAGQYFRLIASTVALPAVQKVALMFLVAWMLAVALRRAGLVRATT